jgi:hypothetical protein
MPILPHCQRINAAHLRPVLSDAVRKLICCLIVSTHHRLSCTSATYMSCSRRNKATQQSCNTQASELNTSTVLAGQQLANL